MYDNPDVSAKIMEAMQEMDTAKRGEMVKEIDRMVLDDVANIPLFFNENIFGVRDSIEYTPRYDRYLLAWEISFK
jgi:dipeptide ABC transporter, substrate-binding protein